MERDLVDEIAEARAAAVRDRPVETAQASIAARRAVPIVLGDPSPTTSPRPR